MDYFKNSFPSADSPLHNSRDERPIAQRDLERLFQQLNLLEDRLSMSSRRLNQSSTREIQESMRGEVVCYQLTGKTKKSYHYRVASCLVDRPISSSKCSNSSQEDAAMLDGG